MRSGILDTGRGSSKKRSPRLKRKKIQVVDAVHNDTSKLTTDLAAIQNTSLDLSQTDSQHSEVTTLLNDSEVSFLTDNYSKHTEEETSLHILPESVNDNVQEWVDNQEGDLNANIEEIQSLSEKSAICSVQVRTVNLLIFFLHKKL